MKRITLLLFLICIVATKSIFSQTAGFESIWTQYGHNFSSGYGMNRICQLTYDWKKIITIGDDNIIRIFDKETGNLLHNIQLDTTFYIYNTIGDIVITHDNKYLISSSLKVWDIETGELIKDLNKDNKHFLWETKISYDDSLICGFTNENGKDYPVIKVINTNDGSIVSTIDIGSEMNDFAFIKNTKKIVISDKINAFYIWDIEKESVMFSRKLTEFGFTPVENIKINISPDNKTGIFYCINNSKFLVYNFETNKVIQKWNEPIGLMQSPIFNNDSKYCIYTLDGRIVFRDVTNGKIAKTINPVSSVDRYQLSPDGKELLTSDDFQRLSDIYDIERNIPLQSILSHCTDMRNIEFSNNNEFLFTIDCNSGNNFLSKFDIEKRIRLWSYSFFEQKKEYHYFWLNPIAESPDGKTIAIAGSENAYLFGENNIIIILNTETGERTGYFEPHKMDITSIHFINNSELATSSFDSTVKIWDYSTGKLKRTLKFPQPVLDFRLIDNFIYIFTYEQETYSFIEKYDFATGNFIGKSSNYMIYLLRNKPYCISHDNSMYVTSNAKDTYWGSIKDLGNNNMYKGKEWLTALCLTPVDNSIAAGSDFSKVFFFDKENYAVEDSLSEVPYRVYRDNSGVIVGGAVRDIEYSNDGRYFAFCTETPALYLYKTKPVSVNETVIESENNLKLIYLGNNIYEIELTGLNPQSVEVMIYDYLGNQIKKTAYTDISGRRRFYIDAEALSAGLYFCLVRADGKDLSEKFIKF